jgi:hydroxypyruvate reductase
MPAHQVSIMISDVPENALDSLASGPTMSDSSTTSDCHRIAEKYGLIERYPASVRVLFQRDALEETPKSDDPAFVRARWWPILSSATAVKAAATKAAALGYAVEIDNSCDDWEYDHAADHLLARLKELRRGASRVCLISAGEVVVRVTRKPGIGGRNQQFALYCADKIAGENVAALSAGTDGIDGNSEAAGAVVDGSTMRRAREQKLNSAEALARFDAYSIFEKLGDAVITGPTGNNVRDLRILLAG